MVGIQIFKPYDFYEYVKNIEQNAETMTEYTYKGPCIMASDDLKELKMVLNNWFDKKVQVGKDQEKAQSEKDSHSKNRGGKKPN